MDDAEGQVPARLQGLPALALSVWGLCGVGFHDFQEPPPRGGTPRCPRLSRATSSSCFQCFKFHVQGVFLFQALGHPSCPDSRLGAFPGLEPGWLALGHGALSLLDSCGVAPGG
ncbi:hypothetical protein H1C71_012016 [Ictidomys tridecemlineatus]|nr:hypothetical protein H1C71_012010 [Ictidomys tridecemlineatus]KAG3290714.1 hypothetical protein H1C71_012016 [Ictidomys tridecemlineatus]KAG3290715.1 hypothetical protein H1C71_012016 [Ictidomys tridecemlineatus]KAG3290716.1 hypothetical protein H1C71_012016 [Ictidomys tridecemlineatus]